MKNSTEKPDGERFFDGRTFVPARLARELMRENRYITRPQDETIFRYNPDRGIYDKEGNLYVMKEIMEKLGESPLSRRSKQTEKCLKSMTMGMPPTPPAGMIAVHNGILDIFTGELRPFSPDIFLINGLQWEYDKSAKCPAFLKFLGEVVPDEKQQMVLQEFLGYCLFPDCRFKKVLILLGWGANGKSALLKVWIKFLGEENVSFRFLRDLETNKSALSGLYGKLANNCYWLPDSGLKKTRCFEALLSGDKLPAKGRYTRRFEFNNVAKLFFKCNKLPETRDDLSKSLLIVNFPNQFFSDNPKTDLDLTEKLAIPAEMAGVLNWALAGVKRLTIQNGFTMIRTG